MLGVGVALYLSLLKTAIVAGILNRLPYSQNLLEHFTHWVMPPLNSLYHFTYWGEASQNFCGQNTNWEEPPQNLFVPITHRVEAPQKFCGLILGC